MVSVNGVTKSLPQPDDHVQRQDFKLLIDPAIKKGHAKIYRYNGVFPGVSLLTADGTGVISRLIVLKPFLKLLIALPSSNHRLSLRTLAPGEQEYGLSTKPIYQFPISRFV